MSISRAACPAAMLKSGFSTLQLNALFVSSGFFGMVIGAGLSGYLGDRFGRRSSYQFNLALFGVMSFAAAFAPNIHWLIGARFVMGIGLGAELVVAAGTLVRIHSARVSRTMDLAARPDRQLGPRDRDERGLCRHSASRLALDVRHRGRRRGDRLGAASSHARVAALARIGRPHSRRPRKPSARSKPKSARQQGPLPECARTQNLEVPQRAVVARCFAAA